MSGHNDLLVTILKTCCTAIMLLFSILLKMDNLLFNYPYYDKTLHHTSSAANIVHISPVRNSCVATVALRK